MRHPDQEWRAQLILEPWEAQQPEPFSFKEATWDPWCGLCASYHSFTRDPCNALLGLRDNPADNVRKVCPVDKHPPDGACDCANRVTFELTRRERARRRQRWREHFSRAAYEGSSALLTLVVVAPSRGYWGIDFHSQDVAELVLVDSGASAHLENEVANFDELGKSSSAVDVNVGDMVVCEAEGRHVMYLVAGPPSFGVIEVVRQRTLLCSRARRALFSVRAGVVDLGVRAYFDDSPHLLFPGGERVYFFDVDSQYVLPRFKSKHLAERAAARLRQGLPLHVWSPDLTVEERASGRDIPLRLVASVQVPLRARAHSRLQA